MKGSVVRINNVVKSFDGFVAVNGVSLEIKAGEFFSLLGPSGCGKTTLLRILAGFEEPTSGSIFLDDRDVSKIPPNMRHVNTVFQNYALFPHLSVFENVAFPLRLRRTPKKEVKERVDEYLNLVRLRGKEDHKPALLSGGQRQRVAIARALINEPSVLLLDEPLSALDAKLRQHMLMELDSIHDKIGITFIFVTHDQQEALSVSDRVAVMDGGLALQVGAPFEIYESPANAFVADFIGETNLFEGVVTKVAGQWVETQTDKLGLVKITADDDILPEIGDVIRMTVRPEKIRVSLSSMPAEKPASEHNMFHGLLRDLIYTGFQSKCFIVLDGSNYVLKAVKPHLRYLDDGPDIDWNDPVYCWWHANDGYIVEIIKKAATKA